MRVHTQPCGDSDALEHWVDTIENKVPISRIQSHLSKQDVDTFPESPHSEFAVWGVTNGKKNVNRNKWKTMSSGDLILLYRKKRFFQAGKIIFKTHNENLAKELWGSRTDGETWENIFLIDELKNIDIPIEVFNGILNYKPNYIVQGYQAYDEEKSERIVTALDLDEWDSSTSYDRGKSISERLANLPKTDMPAQAKRRLEQALLKEHLFDSISERKCSICLKLFPCSLLHTAHIKKRQNCTEKERTDLNVVMPICKFGCDDLFEKGYILVNKDGIVEANYNKKLTNVVSDYILGVEGNSCPHFSEATASYFQHRYAINSK